MARPRMVKTKDGGEVTLKNVAPEVADKVKALLQGEESSEPRQEEKKNMSELTNVALGTFRDASDKRWKVAILKYDPATGSATIEKIIVAGDEKGNATERFRILAVENDIV